jgi:hypothetical protein
MSPELKQFIHDLFLLSMEETIRDGELPQIDSQYANPDILSLTRHHKQICDTSNISHFAAINQKIFKQYSATLSSIISHREITALMTNFMVEFVNQLMWITIWYNHTCPPNERISADIVYNRKGLVPQLAKAILKNVNIAMDGGYQHAIIRDLFRGRYTISQNNVDILKKFINIAICILTNAESDEHREFYAWVQNSPNIFGGMRVPKEHILEENAIWIDGAFQAIRVFEGENVTNQVVYKSARKIDLPKSKEYLRNVLDDFYLEVGKIIEHMGSNEPNE